MSERLIESVAARHFEGVDSVDLTLGALTILWGANGQGKSSVRDAIDFALLGEPLRGGTLADLVAQGAKSCEVEVVLGGEKPTKIGRRRTRTSGEATVNAVACKAAEVEAIVRQKVGAAPAVIAASLRAGALLDMTPADRQALLLGLTGAKVDGDAVAAAFERAVVEAAGRARLDLPGSLEAFDAACSRAEGARKMAKRTLADREADLERMPRATASGDAATLAGRLAELQARRDAAVRAGAREQGARDAKLAAMRAELGRMQSESADVGGDPAADEQLVAGESRALEVQHDADKRSAEAAATVAQALADGKSRRALLDRLPKSGSVGPCPALPDTTCPLTDLGALRARLLSAVEDAKTAYRQATNDANEAAKIAALAAQDVERVNAAKARIVKRAEAIDLAQRRAVLASEVAALEAAPAPAPTENQAALDAEIAATRASLDAIEQAARRAAAQRAVDSARQAVEDADAVAKACGPGGVRARLLARAVEPFVQASNDALERLAPGYRVTISDAFELLVAHGSATLRPAQLSDGERTRLVFVLQYAVARLAGVRFLALDRVELADDAGRAALKRLAADCARDGVQVLMLTCAAAPASVPAGVTGYVLEAGRARAIPQAAAQAA